MPLRSEFGYTKVPFSFKRIQWKKYLMPKDGRDPNETLFAGGGLYPNEAIIAYRQTKGDNQFFKFATIFEEDLDTLKYEGHDLHEIIPAYIARKPFFDIDIDNKAGEYDTDYVIKVFRAIKAAIFKTFIDCGIPDSHLYDNMELFNRHRKGKYSFHYYYTGNYLLQNYHHQRAFNARIMRYIPLEYRQFFDALDKKTQNFALPFCCSKGVDLMPNNPNKPCYLNISDCLCRVVDPSRGDYEPINIPGYVEEDPEPTGTIPADVEKYMTIFNTAMPELAKSLGTPSKAKTGPFINLKRLSDYHCPICEEMHTDTHTLKKSNPMDGATLLVLNGSVMLMCARDTNRTKLHVGYATDEVPPPPSSSEKLSGYIKDQATLFAPKPQTYPTNVKVIQYESKYCKRRALKLGQVRGFKANKGTGKTVECAREIAELDKANKGALRICAISMRVSLADQLCESLKRGGVKGMTHYTRDQGRGMLTSDKIAVQYESLLRIKNPKFDVLMIDEVTQLESQLFSSTVRNVNLNFQRFKYMMASAKTVIFMDADITPLTIQHINDLRGNKDKRIELIHNTYVSPYKAIIDYRTNENQLSQMRDDFYANKKFVVACNNAKDAGAVEHFLKSLNWMASFRDDETGPEQKARFAAEKKELAAKKERILLLTSETSSLERQQEALRDPNEEWVKYDVVIYTPLIQSGVSFDRVHFNKCYGRFTNMSCGPAVCSQMLHRVRSFDAPEGSVCYDISIKERYDTFRPTNPAEIATWICEREQIYTKDGPPEYLRFEETDEGIQIQMDTMARIYVDVKARENRGKQFFMTMFMRCEYANGARFQPAVKVDEMASEANKTAIKAAKVKSLEEKAGRIAAAKPDGPEEELSTYQQRHLFLSRYYNVDKITPQFVQVYNEPKVIEAFTNLQDYFKGAAQVLEEEKASIKFKSGGLAYLTKPRTRSLEIVEDLLFAAGFDGLTDTDVQEKKSFDWHLSNINEAISGNFTDIRNIWGTKRKKYTEMTMKSALQFMNGVLSKYAGVSIKAVRKNKRTTGYRLEHELLGTRFYHPTKAPHKINGSVSLVREEVADVDLPDLGELLPED